MLLKFEVFRENSGRDAVVFHPSAENKCSFSYAELWNAARAVQEAIKNQQQNLFGVTLEHCPALVAVICGISLNDSTFCCLKLESIDQTICQSVNMCHLFVHSKNTAHFETRFDKLKIIQHFTLLGEQVVLLRLEGQATPEFIPRIAYCALTSGSTGQPKFVQVPTECILPNLESLEAIFQLKSTDQIYVSSPPSFDPFVVDIFLALRNGGCLILVASELRLGGGERLLRVLFHQNATTFMQITPSLFRRWHDRDIRRFIEGDRNSLRCLVLGGEPFPVGLEVPASSKVALYNIYGITEISCWATMERVVRGDGEVALGSPLDSTILLQLRDPETDATLDVDQMPRPVQGQLYIGSAVRKCFVDGEDTSALLNRDQVCYRSTGDLVELRANGKYYFLGRCDDVVKRFGVRVNLAKIEEVADLCEDVTKSSAIFHEQMHKLVLFYTTNNQLDSESTIRQYLRSKLEDSHMPDEIVAVVEIPLSMHGKINKQLLKQRIEDDTHEDQNTKNDVKDFFCEKIYGFLSIRLVCGKNEDTLKRFKPDLDRSFIAYGGTSMQAVQLVTEIQNLFSFEVPDLASMLLDNSVPLNDVLHYLSDAHPKPTDSPAVSSSIKKISIKTRFDLGKCIDASPIVWRGRNRRLVAVGSHSHKVVVVDSDSDEIVSQLVLPDRVESAVSYLLDCGSAVVGCYDGFLYCFELWTGAIRWNFDSGGMIKCKPLVVESTIIFGNYADTHNLFTLNLHGKLIRKSSLGSKGILSSPISLAKGKIFVATLDGSYCCFDHANGASRWSGKFESPVFANAAWIADERQILVAEVRGVLHCLSEADGAKLWNITTSGNLFSTPHIGKHLDCWNVLFGCHDKHVYCYSWRTGTSNLANLRWRLRLQSAVYCSCVVMSDTVVACSISGHVNLVSYTSGQLEGFIKLDGEIFSSPASLENLIYVGCRDNYLYKLQIGQNYNNR